MTDVRVIVPWTELHPATEQSVSRFAPQAEFVDVRFSGTAYFDLLTRVWADGRTFVIIEHDIEIRRTSIPDLLACPQPWCGFTYCMGPAGYMAAFGCTKFDESLMRDVPDLLEKVWNSERIFDRQRMWAVLDGYMAEVLADEIGVVLHPHNPPVKHHNEEKNRQFPQEYERDDFDGYDDPL